MKTTDEERWDESIPEPSIKLHGYDDSASRPRKKRRGVMGKIIDVFIFRVTFGLLKSED